MDQNGRNYLATIVSTVVFLKTFEIFAHSKTYVQGPGDLWYFPPGVPHSLQATAEGNGTEFLLVFDSGDFDENNTFLVSPHSYSLCRN